MGRKKVDGTPAACSLARLVWVASQKRENGGAEAQFVLLTVVGFGRGERAESLSFSSSCKLHPWHGSSHQVLEDGRGRVSERARESGRACFPAPAHKKEVIVVAGGGKRESLCSFSSLKPRPLKKGPAMVMFPWVGL